MSKEADRKKPSIQFQGIPDESVSTSLSILVSTTSSLVNTLQQSTINIQSDGDIDGLGQDIVGASLEIAGATKKLLLALDLH